MEIYLYIFLLTGSPIFGLKALILGGGRNQISSYSSRFSLIRDAIILGLSVVGVPLLFSFCFGLEPLFLSVLVFVFTFSIGQVFSIFNGRRVSQPEVSEGEKMTDGEIRSMLKNRGLETLIKNESRNDKSSSE